MTHLRIARLAIIGSRTIDPLEPNLGRVLAFLSEHYDRTTITHIVSGGKYWDAKTGRYMGADSMANTIAALLGMEMVNHVPDKARIAAHVAAGLPYRTAFAKEAHARNTLIAEGAEACLALLDKPLERSRGTFDTVTKFRRLGKDVVMLELKA